MEFFEKIDEQRAQHKADREAIDLLTRDLNQLRDQHVKMEIALDRRTSESQLKSEHIVMRIGVINELQTNLDLAHKILRAREIECKGLRAQIAKLVARKLLMFRAIEHVLEAPNKIRPDWVWNGLRRSIGRKTY